MAELENGLKIDPGHGGGDSGAIGNGLIEKDFVLMVSLYQYERFKELGVPVSMTRKTDVTLDPAERTKIVRESGLSHCLSNHINAGGGDGAEFIHSIHSDGKLENDMANRFKEVGQNVRRVFTRESNRYAGKDYYFMHRNTGSVRTTIAEYGFVDSSKDDVEQLNENWKEYAECVVAAYCKELGYEYEKPKTDREETKSEWEKAMERSAKKAREKGVSDGTRLKDNLTRGEFLVMADRLGLLDQE